jgi:hypothetical protein
MRKHIFDCKCTDTEHCKIGTWGHELISTAGGVESELEKALDLVEGPWKLSPIDIVHKFGTFAINDIKWVIRFLWDCQRRGYAKKLDWDRFRQALVHARRQLGDGKSPWSREVFKKAEECGLPEALEGESRLRAHNPAPGSSAAGSAEQTPTRHTEQMPTRNSSARRPERTSQGSNTPESLNTPCNHPTPDPRAAESAEQTPPRHTEQVSTRSSSARRPESTSLGSSAPKTSSTPYSNQTSDPSAVGSAEQTHLRQTEQVPTRISSARQRANAAPSDDSALTDRTEDPDSTSASAATAPLQTSDDTEPEIAAVINELSSTSAVSTRTLCHILNRFLPTSKGLIDDTVKILDLHHLIHSTASEQAQNQDTGRMVSESAHTVSDRDIDTWTPSRIEYDGVETFILPFTAQSEVPSVFYVLGDSICHVYYTIRAQDNVLLTQRLPEKLIRAVAGSDTAKLWETVWVSMDNFHDYSREDDFGLQVLGCCLDYALFKKPTPSKDKPHFPFRMVPGLWRAVLATAFDESAGTQYFDHWMEGRWSPQESTPDDTLPDLIGYPETKKSRKTLDRLVQQQLRLEDVIEHGIQELQIQFQDVRQRSEGMRKEITHKKEKIKRNRDEAITILEKKITWAYSEFFRDEDDDVVEACPPLDLGAPKRIKDQLCAKKLALLQAQERATNEALKTQDQLLAALGSGTKYVQTAKIKIDTDVLEAQSSLQSHYHQEKAKHELEAKKAYDLAMGLDMLRG